MPQLGRCSSAHDPRWRAHLVESASIAPAPYRRGDVHLSIGARVASSLVIAQRTIGPTACLSLSHKPRPGLWCRKIYGYFRTNALHMGGRVGRRALCATGWSMQRRPRDERPVMPHIARQVRHDMSSPRQDAASTSTSASVGGGLTRTSHTEPVLSGSEVGPKGLRRSRHHAE